MMAHKLVSGTSFLFMTTGSSLRVRPVTPAIIRPQARTNIHKRVRPSQDQAFAHQPFISHLSVTISSPLIDGPHRRRSTAGVMPRSGYDTTNMRMAANPRPAGSASGTGKARNDSPSSGGNSDGSGSGSGRRVAGRRNGNGRDGDDNGSAKTPEQESGQGDKNEEAPTTGETTDHVKIPWKDVHIPLEGRGWTFWL